MLDVIRRAILSFVATVNEDGSPNLSPKAIANRAQ
nr:pyridoxamine 5'-phosphate oxidase family protein [Trinickia violacea]